MNLEPSNASPVHTSRAAAQNNNSAGLSRPAVSFQLNNTLPAPEQERQLPDVPWQPMPIVQKKKITIKRSSTSNNWGPAGKIDHRDLLYQIKKRDVNDEGEINISLEDSYYIPIDDLISCVESAIDDDNDAQINEELALIISTLERIRDGEEEPKKGVKRKNEEIDNTSNKKTKKGDQPKKGVKRKNEEPETTPNKKAKTDTGENSNSSEEPLKFIAWNANHFGKGNSLQEAEIIECIRSLDIKNIVNQISELKKELNKELTVINVKLKIEYSEAEIMGYLHILNTVADKLPHFTKISEVNQLMNAAGSIAYIFKRLASKDKFYTPKVAIMKVITGSLKKYYMIEHSVHLMDVHPNLIMGFNEVGEGVSFLQEMMQDKEDAEGGLKVEKGPKLQSVSLNVTTLNDYIEMYNRQFEKKEDEKDKLPLMESKKSYTDADFKQHNEAYELAGEPEDALTRSQIEYYPLVFNTAKYNYDGFITVSGNEIKTDTAEIDWTKNPHLNGYSKFRPIVVHKLIRKDKEGNAYGTGIWYGMIHTTPSGNEFDRKDIYEGQLKEALPRIKALAESQNAQLIVGGDYYIADEALVKDTSSLRIKENKYKTESDNDFLLPRKEIKDKGWKSNTKIGVSPDKEHSFTGTAQEVRNLLHPATFKPYNYKRNIENENLESSRSITGTNKTELGLQSADYFIIDPNTSKTHRAAVINPVTGAPFSMESEDKEISNAWFSFSDHIPVMLVVSSEENDKKVNSAFPSNKNYFNKDPANMNAFDLAFLQVSNAITHAREDDIELSAEIEETFVQMQEKRESGKYTDEDIITLNNLKEVLPEQELISMAMFEPYQSANSFITTILYQIWTDIYNLQLDEEEGKLLDFIQDTRMIIKEDKINAVYNIHKGEDPALLYKYLGEGYLEEIDKLYKKKNRNKEDVAKFIKIKKTLQQDILEIMLERIGIYAKEVENDMLFNEREEYDNFVMNYKLLGEIIGRKVNMSNERKYENEYIDDEHNNTYDSLPKTKGGIPNNGNQCFLNSVCQLLSQPQYTELLLDDTVRSFIEKVTNEEDIDPTEVTALRSHLIDYGKVNTHHAQEDAAELLVKLMDEIPLDPDLKEEQQAQHDQIFKFAANNMRTLLAAEYKPEFDDKPEDKDTATWIDNKNTGDPITGNVLIIPIDEESGLINYLNKKKVYEHKPDYSNMNTVNWAWVNEKWVSQLKVQEKLIFTRLPPVLTIGLSRFNNDLSKLQNAFEMPTAFELYEEGEDGVVLKTYTLNGFIYHKGPDRKQGHYLAHKKDEEGNWKKANDGNVNNSDMISNREGAFPYDINHGYVYSYVLSDSTPVEEAGDAKTLDAEQDESSDDKSDEHEWLANAKENIKYYKQQQQKKQDTEEEPSIEDDGQPLYDSNAEDDYDAIMEKEESTD